MSDKRFPWRSLLFVSVALNLLVAGAVIGAVGSGVRLQQQSSEAIVASMPGARTFLASLPEDARGPVRREIARTWIATRELRLAARAARVEALEAVAAEPYQAERVRAAFARMRAADQAVIAAFHDNLLDAVGRLTPEQRAQVVEALRQRAPAAALTDEADAPAAPALAPATPAERAERREAIREAIRERIRERREQRLRQPSQQTAPSP